MSALSVGQCFTLATVMEATAPKPGNVHRGADFEDLSYPDFVVAASLVGPRLDADVAQPIGQTLLNAVRATRNTVGTNTNLGTLLLVVPLTKIPRDQALAPSIGKVLGQLTERDTRDVYAAIIEANPGGIGKVDEADIAAEPPSDLIAAMRLAAERDMVARQYATNYADIFETVVPLLSAAVEQGPDLLAAIVHVHIQLMARFPDSLIARRCGADVAAQSAARAQQILDRGKPGDDAYDYGLSDLDFWLRSDGHRRNPGTTADLVAAGLFIALRDAIIKPPFRLARLD